MTTAQQFPNDIEWIDFDGEDPQVATRLEQLQWVPEAAKTLLLDTENPGMYRSMKDGIYLSLFGDLIDRKDNIADIRGMRLYVTDHKVVSVRWGLDDLIQDTKEMVTRSKLANNTAYGLLAPLAVEITQLLSDDIVVSTRLGEDLEFNPPDYHTMSMALGKLRWKLFCLSRRLDPLATVLRFTSTDPFNQIPETDERSLRAAADYVDLYLKTLASNQTRSDLLQEHLANQTNVKIVRSSYRLTVVATVFLPLTFITGLLGMNVAGIPEDHDPFGFWLVSGLLLAIGFLSWSILDRKNPIRATRKRHPSHYARIKRRLTRARLQHVRRHPDS